MRYLIINSHPYDKSFNYSLCLAIKEKLEGKHEVAFIDLVADGFNPTMTASDLNLWRTGQTDDELVKKYMAEIEKADALVFSFPLWWGNMPAILKGFCDKVLLPNFAYKYDENHNMIPNLTDKKAVVILTMELTKDLFNNMFNDPVKNAFINVTLKTCGIETDKYFQIEQISTSGEHYTTDKFHEVLEYFEGL